MGEVSFFFLFSFLYLVVTIEVCCRCCSERRGWGGIGGWWRKEVRRCGVSWRYGHLERSEWVGSREWWIGKRGREGERERAKEGRRDRQRQGQTNRQG